MADYSTHIEPGQIDGAIQRYDEVFEEAEMAENICREIPGKTSPDIHYVLAKHELDVMIVDSTSGTGDDAAEWTFAPFCNANTDRRADIGIEQAVIRASIDNGIKSLALRMIMDNFDCEDRPPDAPLVGNCRIVVRERFVVYAQRENTRGCQLSGTFTSTGSSSPLFSAASTASS